MTLWQRGDFWYVIHVDAAGTRRQLSTGEKNRARAEIKARQLLRESTRLIDYSAPFFLEDCPHASRLRIEGRKITARHLKQQRSYLVNVIWDDPIARKPIEQIKRSDVLDFRARAAKQHPPNTANKILNAFKVVMSEAEYREDIPANPAARVGKIAYKQKQSGVYNAEQLTAYIKAAKPPMQFVALTGVRIGEMSALHWDALTFFISIERSIENWSRMTTKAPKWDKPREIPFSRAVKHILPAQSSGPVFKSIRGCAINYSWIKRHHAAAIKKAGLPTITRHALRASLHTILAAEGVHTLLLGAWFGWSPSEVARVQRGYFRPTIGQLQQVADLIDDLFFTAVDSRPPAAPVHTQVPHRLPQGQVPY
jgi:integrase